MADSLSSPAGRSPEVLLTPPAAGEQADDLRDALRQAGWESRSAAASADDASSGRACVVILSPATSDDPTVAAALTAGFQTLIPVLTEPMPLPFARWSAAPILYAGPPAAREAAAQALLQALAPARVPARASAPGISAVPGGSAARAGAFQPRILAGLVLGALAFMSLGVALGRSSLASTLASSLAPSAHSVTGHWNTTLALSQGLGVAGNLTLRQDGSTVTGSIPVAGAASQATGTLSGQHLLLDIKVVGVGDYALAGVISSDFTHMSGAATLKFPSDSGIPDQTGTWSADRT